MEGVQMYYYFIHLDRGTIDFLDTTVYTFIKKARKFPLSLKKRKQGEPSTLKAKRCGNRLPAFFYSRRNKGVSANPPI